MNYLNNEEDTIVALSTPLGQGAISVIRLSGTNALSIVNGLVKSKSKITPNHARRAIFANFFDLKHQNLIDEVVITFFNSPKSYTGEDVVEISCHCNPLIIDAIIRSIVESGARTAEPGEFTFRAFMNNKLDLSQAEAVAEVIRSKTHQSLNQSLRHLEGKLFESIQNIKREIMDYLSLVEINLDFSDEEIEALPLAELGDRIGNTIKTLKRLKSSYDYGRLLQEGIKLLLIGKANVGKSSLLNLLMGKDRAIVSNIPGTTRDYLEVGLQIDGLAVQAVDTAGIRHTLDTIESIGVNRTLEQLKNSDIAICMFEGNQPLDKDDDKLIDILANNRDRIRFIVLANKIDLGEDENTLIKLKRLNLPFLKTSIMKKTGIDSLKKQLKEQVIGDESFETEEVVITSSRHMAAIGDTISALNHSLKALKKKSTEEIISVDLRLALDTLGKITGETTSEEILNHIFQNFCIGK